MDKRRLYRVWMRMRHLKLWLLIALLGFWPISIGLSVFALRQNNLHMVKLRNAVYQTDKDNGDVEAALRDLRIYVYSHMNTNLETSNGIYPPIQLQYTYERLMTARNAGTSAAVSSNEDLYNQAQKYCEQAIPSGFSGSYRLSCIQAFVKERSLSPNTVETIPKNLYQFDFVSPRWSPDLAGWSLLCVFLIPIAVLSTGTVMFIIRRLSRR